MKKEKLYSNELIEFCKEHDLTLEQAIGGKKIDGSLDLSGLTSIPDGFSPTVGVSLDLRNLTSIPDGFNPTVGGSLDLSSLTSIPEGFNPTAGGSMDLSGLTSIPEEFNPTVGGSLHLSNLTSIPDGFNPTVGGSLYLSGLSSVPDGFNPTVGGYLFLKNESIDFDKDVELLSWQDEKYIKIDGIFTEVVSHKGNVWRVKRLNSDEVFYLITDGGGKYAHGDTLKEAKEGLIYKLDGRNKSDFAGLTLDSELSFEEAIVCYRVITGACSFGVNDYIKNRLGKRFKADSVKNIIKRTEGEYGNKEFSEFFVG